MIRYRLNWGALDRMGGEQSSSAGDQEATEMGLRDRRNERKEERQSSDGGAPTRFQMRQKLLSIGDDFWVENEDGDRVFRVDGKAVRLRDTLDLEDAHGTTLCRFQTRALRIRDSLDAARGPCPQPCSTAA